MRSIIFHYHYFKNAGTSFDGVLKKSFPGKCVFREFGKLPDDEYKKAVSDWIIEEQDAVAFSSHTADLPNPIMPGVNVVPFFFIRHPIVRIKSVYEFEKKQTPRNTFGSQIAEHANFSEYVTKRLEIKGDRQCRNFHCCRLARGSSLDGVSELAKSKDVLNSVECFGLVERFEESISIFYDVNKDIFPDFMPITLRLNTTSNSPLGAALLEIKTLLGSDFYEELLDANSDDLLLYDYAQVKFDDLLAIRQLSD